MTLGEKISKLRVENNFTQEQLAEILGVSRQSVSKWESDVAYPETAKLIEIGKLFDCSMDYLLKDDVTEKNVTGDAITVEKIAKKVLTEKNKSTAKKALKIAGIIFAIVLAIDIISLIVYFGIAGIPH